MESNRFYIVFRLIFIFVMIFTVTNIIDDGQAALMNKSGKTLDRLYNQKADLCRVFPINDILYSKNSFYLWDFESKQFYSLNKMPILLSAVAEWKISNLDVFYKSVRTIKGANNRLDDIIPSAIRAVLNSYNKSDFCEFTSNGIATTPVKQEYIGKIIDLFSPHLRELGMEVLNLKMVVK